MQLPQVCMLLWLRPQALNSIKNSTKDTIFITALDNSGAAYFTHIRLKKDEIIGFSNGLSRLQVEKKRTAQDGSVSYPVRAHINPAKDKSYKVTTDGWEIAESKTA